MTHLLEVQDLEVKFALRFGELTAINGISFTLDKGERLGIVGESGAGKSVTGFAIINLISKPGYISDGKILFEGEELNRLPDERCEKFAVTGLVWFSRIR
jgi:peptide/nickel transport system ATP-binding protein